MGSTGYTCMYLCGVSYWALTKHNIDYKAIDMYADMRSTIDAVQSYVMGATVCLVMALHCADLLCAILVSKRPHRYSNFILTQLQLAVSSGAKRNVETSR